LLDFTLFIQLSLVFCISLLLNYLLIKYASLLGLVDIPNERSMHNVTKSRAGGVAIFIAFFIGIAIKLEDINYYIVSAFLLIFLLGIYDDLKEASSKAKFFWIIVATTFLYVGDFFILSLGTFYGTEIQLAPIVTYLFLVFAIVGFVNAMNLIDGLDGLAGGMAIIILGSFAYMGYKMEDIFLFYTSLSLIVSLCAFLIFNWYPSKIFMGDTGSLSLGLSIGVCSIYAINKDYISPVSILLIAAVPILDTLIVMLRRIFKGKSPFLADKQHIHHILLKKQKSVARTSIILILLQAILTYIGLGFKVRDDLIVLILFVMFFVLFYLLLTNARATEE